MPRILLNDLYTPKKPNCLLYNHRVSSNSNLPDLETNNNYESGKNPPRTIGTNPVFNGMSQQKLPHRPERQQKLLQETHTLLNKQPYEDVPLKKKEVS